MLRHELSLTHSNTPDEVRSMATPYPEFLALRDLPTFLGHQAHKRLEDIFGQSIATQDSELTVANNQPAEYSGMPFGDRIGREKEFVRNLSSTEADVARIAEDNGVSTSKAWDDMMEVVTGSGIGLPMHRTLDRPLDGVNGAIDYLSQARHNGIHILVRENIANWGARRNDRAIALLGSLPVNTLANVQSIIYAGSNRKYNGPELWRPELQPYVSTDLSGKQTCSLTELSAATTLHAPSMRKLLDKRPETSHIKVHTVGVTVDKTAGNDVVQAVIDSHGKTLTNGVVVEVGNAPAGYTQLEAGVLFGQKLDFDPTQQYIAITDGVEIVHKDFFASLSLERRSKVQNVVTALNSINGWMSAISNTNKFLSAKR